MLTCTGYKDAAVACGENIGARASLIKNSGPVASFDTQFNSTAVDSVAQANLAFALKKANERPGPQ